MWQLIRLTFLCWRRQKQSAVDRLSQTDSRLNVAPQVGDNHLFICDDAIRPNENTISRQCQTKDTRQINCFDLA